MFGIWDPGAPRTRVIHMVRSDPTLEIPAWSLWTSPELEGWTVESHEEGDKTVFTVTAPADLPAGVHEGELRLEFPAGCDIPDHAWRLKGVVRAPPEPPAEEGGGSGGETGQDGS